MKKEERTPGLKDNLRVLVYFAGLTNRVAKLYIPTILLSSFFKALAPFINILLPKFLIEELVGEQRVNRFIMLVGIIIIGNFILNIINKWFEMKVLVTNEELKYRMDLVISEKIMDMDFEKIEDPEILDIRERALFTIYNEGAIGRLVENFANLVSYGISITALSAIILSLNSLLIFVIVGIIALSSKIFKKIQILRFKDGQKTIPNNRAFGYFGYLTADFTLGKDIRLYDIGPIIMNKVNGFNMGVVNILTNHYKTVGKYNGLININLQIQMIIIYSYLTARILNGTLGLGDFTMYTSATIVFCSNISTFVNTFIEIGQLCRYLDIFIQFEGIKSKDKDGTESIEDLGEYVIQFKNVSFKYPKKTEYSLKDINITINFREKLSVVGLNGAGKTTFIKLLTRLYEPTEGQILLNGVDIKKYKYQEYMKILSVVFQDYKLLAFSVKENIALNGYSDVPDEKIMEILNKAGLEKDIGRLKKGINTSIYKSFDSEGIEFSGGQLQKLAIGRALFKNSSIVVLDEPTAALDPIAEFEIYNKFKELVGDKTAIFISHRLSSCRFCDKIAVFDKGRIIEYGNHNELMKLSQSTYARMYNAQSQYYVETAVI